MALKQSNNTKDFELVALKRAVTFSRREKIMITLYICRRLLIDNQGRLVFWGLIPERFEAAVLDRSTF